MALRMFDTLHEATEVALRESRERPTIYFTFVACFGVNLAESTRLGVFAPSDSCCDYYIRNGRVRKFTERQVIADQLATPQVY